MHLDCKFKLKKIIASEKRRCYNKTIMSINLKEVFE